MDLVPEGESIVAEEEKEDRISKLPDDIIHRILSFLDMKYAVQTSAVSRKWKHVWTSMPYLNLNSQLFPKLPQFAKFVKQTLSRRKNHTEVSTVDLRFTGSVTQFFVKSIVSYAYSHNVRQMTFAWLTESGCEFPQFLFSSHTLKNLTIAVNDHYYSTDVYGICRFPELTWDFPSLETLHLSGMALGHYHGAKNINLFSKCVNLKDLTLHKCSMYGLKIVNVCCPQLSNLTISRVGAYPEVFKVVAPQLKNLTASISSIFPRYIGVDFLQLSVEGFSSLEKVNLSKSNDNDRKERNFTRLLDLFQKLSCAKCLILDMDIIQTLSSDLDLLSRVPCPFHNLKCLKINTSRLKHTDPIPKIPTEVRNYLLDNSPSATFIIDSTQVSHKRPRQQVHDNTITKKVARLNEKVQNQDEVIRDNEGKIQELKEKLKVIEAEKLQHENLMSHIVIQGKMEKLEGQIESGNPNYEVIRSVGCDIKSVIDLLPESLKVAMEAEFSCQYEELKSRFHAHVNATQWAKIENELGNLRDNDRTRLNNTHVQSDVSVAELPRARGPSSTNNEMIRLREASTSSESILFDREILAQVIKGKQHGHISGVGKKSIFSASQARQQSSLAELEEKVKKQEEELKAAKEAAKTTQSQVAQMMAFMRSQPGWAEQLARGLPSSSRNDGDDAGEGNGE